MEPRATTIPDMERMFTVSPIIFMPMKVKNMERGIERPMTMVALRSLRNRNITRMAMMIPRTPDCMTVLMDELTMLLSSAMSWKERAPPVSASHSSRIFSISLVIFMALPSLRLNTSTTTTSPSEERI